MLVFLSSAAVLVLEILAGRMLAPYVGVSLETYTAVIGTMLAGIAVGSWGGGALADRVDPRRLLGPLLVVGGTLAIASIPIVRAFGSEVQEAGPGDTLLLAITAFFLPGVVLSAVSPTIVKLQLHSLEHTGGVVGRLSGIGTFGALVGTFVTGYLLVETTPTKTVVTGVGAFLITLGLGLWAWLSRAAPVIMVVLLVGAVGTGVAAAGTTVPCEIESAYFCMRVERDFSRPSGRVLWLDNLEHSYVDLRDPRHLEFDYIKSFAAALEVAFPGDPPIDAVHVGGGGFTFPRYIDATNPGSRNLVLEIDPAVRDLARDELGLRTSRTLRVKVGDGRVGVRARAANSADVVVGDAFGGLSVPWHLTTREFIADVDRVLRPDGIYLVNVIDYAPYRFARAELASLRERFGFVAAAADPITFLGQYADNVVLIASDRDLDVEQLRDLTASNGQELLTGAALDRWIGNAPVLRDDYAPVDQWISRARR